MICQIKSDLIQFNYQRVWHKAKEHRIRNILKSRQIGETYYFAHEAFVDALTTGHNQIFLSASKKQALQFRSYIVNYAKQTADVDLKGETIKLPRGRIDFSWHELGNRAKLPRQFVF